MLLYIVQSKKIKRDEEEARSLNRGPEDRRRKREKGQQKMTRKRRKKMKWLDGFMRKVRHSIG